MADTPAMSADSTVAHTPGPWHLGGKDGLIVYAADGFAVCNAITFHGTFKQGQSEANARLLSAAPDLLEALEAVELARMSDEPDHWQRATDLTDAGITKAKGPTRA